MNERASLDETVAAMLWATMTGPRSSLADVPLAVVEERFVDRGTVVRIREVSRQRTSEVWLADEMMTHGADAQLDRMGYRRRGRWIRSSGLAWVAEVELVHGEISECAGCGRPLVRGEIAERGIFAGVPVAGGDGSWQAADTGSQVCPARAHSAQSPGHAPATVAERSRWCQAWEREGG